MMAWMNEATLRATLDWSYRLLEQTVKTLQSIIFQAQATGQPVARRLDPRRSGGGHGDGSRRVAVHADALGLHLDRRTVDGEDCARHRA